MGKGGLFVPRIASLLTNSYNFLTFQVVKEKGFKLFFVESICNDEKIIESNIKEVKVTSPDYKDYENFEHVLNDFKQRIEHYVKQYETISETEEPDLSWLKIYDTGRKVEVHKHEGHIQARIVYYLMNVHITPRYATMARLSTSQIYPYPILKEGQNQRPLASPLAFIAAKVSIQKVFD